jgi:para-nitrobenzyl esterase
MTIVRTAQGTLRGTSEGASCVFRGVPYAAPPVGALRFQPAQPPRPWAGERDATVHGGIAPQNPSDLRHFMGDFDNPQSEDCLTLTVWTPAADAARRPVLLWLHGGAFVSGAGSLDWYSGARLAAEGDVVVVHANYRLGALGWLCWSGVAPGNMALSDQAMALRWVQANIAAFGGNPDTITLGGQSAGANCTGRMMLDPDVRPSVRRVLLQSGGFGREPSTAADMEPTARVFIQALGIDPDAPDAGAKLRSAPVAGLLRAQEEADQFGFTLPVRQQAWRPLLGEHATAAQLRDATAVALGGKDVLIGVTRHEGHAFIGGPIPFALAETAAAAQFEHVAGAGNGFAAYQARMPGASPAQLVAELRSNQHFIQPALDLAAAASRQGANVHAYSFDWAPAGSPFGAGHCLDLAFAFGTWPDWAEAPMLKGAEATDMAALSTSLLGAIAAFVGTGRPDIGPGMAWPNYMPGEILLSIAEPLACVTRSAALGGQGSS